MFFESFSFSFYTLRDKRLEFRAGEFGSDTLNSTNLNSFLFRVTKKKYNPEKNNQTSLVTLVL